MKTINVMLGDLSGRVINLGYEGENLYTKVKINCIEVFADYPDATVSMVVKPPVGDMYPATITKTGVAVIWNITSSVLSTSGAGSAQITFNNGEEIIKTAIFNFTINNSLIAEGETPDPVQDWIESANATLESLEEISASAEQLPAGSSATAEITTVGGHKNIAIGIPPGATGANAYVWIRYAAAQPTQDSDMKSTPDAWIGIYSGAASTAPTTYTSYTWYEYKGDKGNTGATGANAYVWIRYAANEPTQDSDMKTTPDAWMGVYSGNSSTAPTSYTSYEWYKTKGETGSAENMYADTIPMSENDSTKIATVLGTKADKVSSPTSGDFAGLDSNGNLTDSGKKAADFKAVQSAVSDPSASGTDVEFISGISQDAAGVISPSKKTVRTMTGAGSGTAGTTGLVPAPAAGDNEKYLRGDGTWQAVSGGVSDMTGATSSAAGTHGLVPAPAAGDDDAFLRGDATWSDLPTKNGQAVSALQEGLAIIVDGDTCSTAVPVGGYAYIKNNTHGLTEGLYKNTSASAFPTSGGTADNTVFTAESGVLNEQLMTTEDITLSHVDTTYTNICRLYIRGKFAILRIALKLNSSSSDTVTIGTVPSAYLPAFSVTMPSYQAGAGAVTAAEISGSTGNIVLYKTTASKTYYAILPYFLPD